MNFLDTNLHMYSFMLKRAFVGCGRAKALVSLGCCYNLLSEAEVVPTSCSEFEEMCCISIGFPMSLGARLSPFSLGKSARDLACQVNCMSVLL
jgi:hypothetical protein